MGFDQKDAAIALYRAWEDPEAAAALLLGAPRSAVLTTRGVHIGMGQI